MGFVDLVREDIRINEISWEDHGVFLPKKMVASWRSHGMSRGLIISYNPTYGDFASGKCEVYGWEHLL